MLMLLRNRQHLVYSGLTLFDAARSRHYVQVAITPVSMRPYTDDEIRRYVASGDPMDKAGAYAIQHGDFAPVGRIEGCHTNVMGMPVCHLYRALRTWGIQTRIHPLHCCPLAVEWGDCPWARRILETPTGK